ncbi:pentapeptide repeat-containing protein [Nocardia fluminea]|uniref:pentapeptide repeat-containing protein n=1 Tax=Nocardia fluminea TaxID=134984 RepID=UPI00379EB4C9
MSAVGAQARTKLTALQARMNKNRRTSIGRRAGRIGLFAAVGSALGAGLIVAFAAYGFLRWITPTSDVKAAPIDITRVALTVVAGVGGVVALVIAYRRQRDLEQSKFVERFGAAAAHLGATDVAVRIAGVYAMAGVADESDGLRRQQCIDVLCGYLRLPYTPELGGNHQTKEIRKYAPADPSNPENEQHFEYRQNDREVRKTIVRVIADHLRPEAESSWSASNFDFRTAHLEDVDFSKAKFSGTAEFGGTTFSGTARFDEATFSGGTRFSGATFSGDAWFGGATFGGDAWFGGTTFSGDAGFRKATFSGDAEFTGATFGGGAGFTEATFSSAAGFRKATFSSAAEFSGTTFSSAAGFGGVTFSGDAWFGEATFGGDAGFRKVTFSGDAWFRGTTFSSDAGFSGTTFGGDAGFRKATFSSAAGFRGTTFGGDAGFRGATFSSAAGFGEVTFSGDAEFTEVTFSGDAGFGGATFSSTAEFSKVGFGGRTSFVGVDFGSERIGFAEPRRWGPPSPKFDWGEDGVGTPVNIDPQDWPPVAVAP